MAALRAGVPLVIVPTTWDKPDNALRIVEAGVGVRLAPRPLHAQTLRAAVERVLADRGIAPAPGRPPTCSPPPPDRRARPSSSRSSRPPGGASHHHRPSGASDEALHVPRHRGAHRGRRHVVRPLGARTGREHRDPRRQRDRQRGFGDSRNSYAWSMASFRGKIYVGTSRQTRASRTSPSTSTCRSSTSSRSRGAERPLPARPADLGLSAEIWQYTPATGRWKMVYRSPVDLPNPRAHGKRVARDIAFRGMVVYHDSTGGRPCTSGA